MGVGRCPAAVFHVERDPRDGRRDARRAGPRADGGRAADGAGEAGPAEPTPEAEELFGDALPRARRYAELLAGPGREQGVIGPRELPRLWDRHLVNSAYVGRVRARSARRCSTSAPARASPASRSPSPVPTYGDPPGADGPPRRVAGGGRRGPRARGHGAPRAGGGARDPARVREFDVVTARAVAPIGRLATWRCPSCGRVGDSPHSRARARTTKCGATQSISAPQGPARSRS